MRISTPTEYLAKNYGYEKALEMIAAAGFDCADISFCCLAFMGKVARHLADKA